MKEAKHTYEVGQVFNPFKMTFYTKTISGHKTSTPKEISTCGTSVHISNLIKIRVQEVWEEDPAWLVIRVWDYYGFDHDMWVEATHLHWVMEGPSEFRHTWPGNSYYAGYGPLSNWFNPFEPFSWPTEPDKPE